MFCFISCFYLPKIKMDSYLSAYLTFLLYFCKMK
nr:MAG TPA: hypothetical protein [Caudoviricetes sp.]